MKKHHKKLETLILTAALAICSLSVPSAAASATGWVQDGKQWSYYVTDNSVATQWRKVGRDWYYFNEKGIMQTGWKKNSGKWYYFKGSGAMAVGWTRVGNAWYFMDQNGVMDAYAYREGFWLNKSGKWDGKNKSGKWHHDEIGWWYQDGRWYPKNQWMWIDGYCYYFGSQGYLAENTTVQGYDVDADGVWVIEGVRQQNTNTLKPSGTIPLKPVEDPKPEEPVSEEPSPEEPSSEEPEEPEEPDDYGGGSGGGIVDPEPSSEEPEPSSEDPEPSSEDPEPSSEDPEPSSEEPAHEHTWSRRSEFLGDQSYEDTTYDSFRDSDGNLLMTDDKACSVTIPAWTASIYKDVVYCTGCGEIYSEHIHNYGTVLIYQNGYDYTDEYSGITWKSYLVSHPCTEPLPDGTTCRAEVACEEIIEIPDRSEPIVNNDEKTEDEKIVDTVLSYDYEIVPLIAPLNGYYLIKTENPDPNSFCFVDEDSVYDDGTVYTTGDPDGGIIRPILTIYPDVVYENEETARVHGGYLAKGFHIDGGKLRVMARKVTGQSCVVEVGMSDGEELNRHYYNEYAYISTDATVEMGRVIDDVDYMLETYADGEDDFFDKLGAVQGGLRQISLYRGSYILGETYLSKNAPYYGLSSAYYRGQDFFIYSPYGQKETKDLFVTVIYPYIMDSLGFPGFMGAVAKRLDENAELGSVTGSHSTVKVTHNGETRYYGGQGELICQGIYPDQAIYKFSFTGNDSDLASNTTLASLHEVQEKYCDMEIGPDPFKTQKALTSKDIKKTVGDGAYVQIRLKGFLSDGGGVYSYLYDNHEDPWFDDAENYGHMEIGYFTNCWYDGRYFNRWEYFYPGITFEESVETEQPSIVLKDISIPVPKDGKQYYAYLSQDHIMTQRPLEDYGYDYDTGIWKGYVEFIYDSETECWVARDFTEDWNGGIYCLDSDGRTRISLNSEEYLDAITITMDEAKAMNLDRNTNVDPEEYYNYDGTEEPGTYHKNN